MIPPATKRKEPSGHSHTHTHTHPPLCSVSCSILYDHFAIVLFEERFSGYTLLSFVRCASSGSGQLQERPVFSKRNRTLFTRRCASHRPWIPQNCAAERHTSERKRIDMMFESLQQRAKRCDVLYSSSRRSLCLNQSSPQETQDDPTSNWFAAWLM